MSTNPASSLAIERSHFVKRLIEANKTFTPSLIPPCLNGNGKEVLQRGRNDFKNERQGIRREVSSEMAPHANSPKKSKLLSRIVKNLAGPKSAEYRL